MIARVFLIAPGFVAARVRSVIDQMIIGRMAEMNRMFPRSCRWWGTSMVAGWRADEEIYRRSVQSPSSFFKI